MTEVQAGAILAILPLLLLFLAVDARYGSDLESSFTLGESVALVTILAAPTAMGFIIVSWLIPDSPAWLDEWAALLALLSIATTTFVAMRMILTRLGLIDDASEASPTEEQMSNGGNEGVIFRYNASDGTYKEQHIRTKSEDASKRGAIVLSALGTATSVVVLAIQIVRASARETDPTR